MLAELKSVDRVVVFDNEDELRGIIKGLQPAIMVKGSEYQGLPIIGEDLVEWVHFIKRSAHSSTRIINRS
jgi:bifunctional ADP-heptose synthase (sugar kinase/adenylyltransferase)